MGGVGGRERKEGNDKIIFKLKLKKIEKNGLSNKTIDFEIVKEEIQYNHDHNARYYNV